MKNKHGVERIKLQTNIDKALHKQFKTACFLQDKDMNEVLTELIQWWLTTDEGEFPPAPKANTSNKA